MNKFNAKSNLVLGIVLVISILAFLAVEYGKADSKQKWYNEKLAAARLSKVAAEYLKAKRLENGIFIDAVNDPNKTALIGQEFSLITTDHGNIEAKLSSTNPNFAAVIVQLLKDAGVSENDYVAVAMTGSFPGLNIATLAALETLKLNPVIISSVGSSSWGANDPYFTWLDMESALYQAKIFHNRSIAASIGGSADIGRGLSPEGRTLLKNAIERNNVVLINEAHIEKSIEKRMNIYKAFSHQKPIKAFVNVGGGIASLGNPINGKLFPAGLTPYIADGNYPVDGVMIQMGQKRIPVIHLLNINTLLEKFGLPLSPVPAQEPGVGEIFIRKKYNMYITSVATLVLVVLIIMVFLRERKQHRLGTEVVSDSSTKRTDDDFDNNLI